jgi:mannose-6-phosphate isomerase-like protein (cupin superfamily)
MGPVETRDSAGLVVRYAAWITRRQRLFLTLLFTMKIIRSKSFTATRPWGALDIANMRGITTRLHWTDQPYKWHVNDGEEVFAVLDGRVEMRYREGGVEQSAILETGDVFYASVGTEHVAHPIGVARILVIEAEGSV